jgi:RNA polymerase sigma-70 factor (ECF subfamily)
MNKEASYTAILSEHRDRIFRMCCCYVRDPELRKDAYQQVLINVWQNLDGFQGRSQVGTWIYRITTNTCLGLLQKEQRRHRLFLPNSDLNENLNVVFRIEDEDDPEEDVQMLYACISELLPLDRTLISLYLEDLSTKEMAEVLEISEANVRVKVHRIKKILKESMERKGHGLG